MSKGNAPVAVGSDKSYARSDKCWQAERDHNDRADRHETVAQYLIAQGKPGKAELHRDASGKHVEVAANYKRAADALNRGQESHAANFEDRAEEKAGEAKAFEDKHSLELDPPETNRKKGE